jgi:C4-dicarboxylate-specific signal transduction histidine kinase
VDEARASLEDIAKDGRRAGQIVESIRSMFQVTGQGRALLDANHLVREAVTILRSEILTNDVTLQLEPTPDLPLVRGHRGQLLEVMLNLVTNALDSMASVTHRTRLLIIRSMVHGTDGVSILVEDSGAGIDRESLGRIFEPFFTTKSQGMGLGLAICRSIVEAHGGSLSASPGVQHGCVFRIDLPNGERDRPSKIS